MHFELATATRIIFGPGTIRELPDVVASLGQRVLLVTGAHPERHAHTLDALRAAGARVETLVATGEPTTDDAAAGVRHGRAADVEVVVAIGGGSALDLGKAVAALIPNDGEPLDYLEVIGRGQKLTRPSLPFVAVPTTAGTGSEVTRNAVLTVVGGAVKVSLRSASMLPRVALVDPALTVSLSPATTATTGLDALTQVLEPFVCNATNPIVDGVCREGLAAAARSLRRACQHGEDLAARTDMALASLCGGIALANARLGAVHGLAGPIGGRFPAPHGAVCARLLPAVVATNLQALETRAPAHPALMRYVEAARILTGQADASAHHAVTWLETLSHDLAVPALSHYGLAAEHVSSLVDQAKAASSMHGNPIPLTDFELFDIMHAAL